MHAPLHVLCTCTLSVLHVLHNSAIPCSEDDIALAILRLVEVDKAVLEGAGAAGLAACISGKLDHFKGKK